MNLKRFFPERRYGGRELSRSDEWERPIASFQKDVNRVFDEFFGDSLMPAARDSRDGFFMPRVNVSQSANEITVSAELPGVNEKDVEVSIDRGMLMISGEKKEEQEEKGRNYYYMEQSTGSFHREIPMPEEVDPENVKASFKKGLLKVVVPLLPDAQKERKKIPVKSE